MVRLPARTLLLPLALASALALSACGSRELSLPASEGSAAVHDGAELFTQRCAGCHTLSIAGTEGSSQSAKDREYKDGPNFDQRAERKDQVLYAIRNGGFSGGPMPADIVIGQDAQKVAAFVAKYSGSEAGRAPGSDGSPGKTAPTGQQGDS